MVLAASGCHAFKLRDDRLHSNTVLRGIFCASPEPDLGLLYYVKVPLGSAAWHPCPKTGLWDSSRHPQLAVTVTAGWYLRR